jgi:spermidine/putrescine transport system substrate-binding protein
MNKIPRRTLLGYSLTVPAATALLAACGSDKKIAEPAGTSAGGTTPPATTAPGTAAVTTAPGSAAPPATTAVKALEGTINFANFEGWLGANTITEFNKIYPGITINQITADVGFETLVPKLKNRAGDFDMALLDARNLPVLDKLGVLAKFTPEEVPNAANVDEAFRSRFDPEGDNYVTTDYGRYGIAYRKDLVSEPLTSWKEFLALAPKYSGKVLGYDRPRPMLGAALFAMGKSANTTDQDELNEARDMIKAIKGDFARFSDGTVAEGLLDGSAVMTVANDYEIVAAAAKDPNIVWVEPTDGTLGYIEGWMIFDGPRNDLCKAFMNFLFEPKNFADFVNTLSIGSVMTKANEFVKPELLNNPIVNPAPAAQKNITYVEDIGEAEQLWQQAWDEVKAG